MARLGDPSLRWTVISAYAGERLSREFVAADRKHGFWASVGKRVGATSQYIAQVARGERQIGPEVSEKLGRFWKLGGLEGLTVAALESWVRQGKDDQGLLAEMQSRISFKSPDPFEVGAGVAVLDGASEVDVTNVRERLAGETVSWLQVRDAVLAAKAVREAASASGTEKADALRTASRQPDDSPTSPPKPRKKGRESAAEEPRALDERFSGLTKVGANLKDEDASNATSKRSRK